jgi:hypothetical protein
LAPPLAAWTQTYQYDGFGNLTAKVLNASTTPIGVTASTNRLTYGGNRQVRLAAQELDT